MLFRLGNVTYFLDVAPSNPLQLALSPPYKFKDLVAKQHPTLVYSVGVMLFCMLSLPHTCMLEGVKQLVLSVCQFVSLSVQ